MIILWERHTHTQTHTIAIFFACNDISIAQTILHFWPDVFMIINTVKVHLCCFGQCLGCSSCMLFISATNNFFLYHPSQKKTATAATTQPTWVHDGFVSNRNGILSKYEDNCLDVQYKMKWIEPSIKFHLSIKHIVYICGCEPNWAGYRECFNITKNSKKNKTVNKIKVWKFHSTWVRIYIYWTQNKYGKRLPVDIYLAYHIPRHFSFNFQFFFDCRLRSSIERNKKMKKDKMRKSS